MKTQRLQNLNAFTDYFGLVLNGLSASFPIFDMFSIPILPK